MINATPVRPLSPGSSSTFGSGTSTTDSVRPTVAQATSQDNSSSPPPSDNQPKNKGLSRKLPLKYILGGLFLLLLLVGGGAGLYLMRMNQDVRQQAYGGGCSTAGATQCVEGKKEICDGSTWRPTNEACTPAGSPSTCNPKTHCCDPKGCSYTYKTWTK